MLHGRRVEIVRDLLQHGVTGVAIVAENADLDQPVRQEVDVDLVQDGRRQAVVTDHHDRIEMVRLCAQRPARIGSELEFHQASIVDKNG